MKQWLVRLELPQGAEEACYNSEAKGLAVMGALLREYESSADRISMLNVSTGRLVSFSLRSGSLAKPMTDFPAIKARKPKRKLLPNLASYPNGLPS